MNKRTWLAILALCLFELLSARYAQRRLFLDLPLVVTVYFGLKGEPIRATVAGTLAGLMQDFLWNLPLGINGLAKTLAGFVAALAGRYFIVDSVAAQLTLLLLMGILNTAVFVGMAATLDLVLPQAFWRHCALQIAVTSVAGILVFKVLGRAESEKVTLLGRRYR